MFNESPIQAESFQKNFVRHSSVYIGFTVVVVTLLLVAGYVMSKIYGDSDSNKPIYYPVAEAVEKVNYFDPTSVELFTVPIRIKVIRNHYCPSIIRTFWSQKGTGTPVFISPEKQGGFAPMGASTPIYHTVAPKLEGTFNMNTYVISYCADRVYTEPVPTVTVVIKQKPSTAK